MRTSEPSDMTPDERHQEISGIFAKGVLRLRKHHGRLAESNSPKSAEFATEELEVPPETRLSVTQG